MSCNYVDNDFFRFICCLKLRYIDPNNKLNALVTSRKVYLMTVGSPTRDNVVFDVLLEKLYEAQPRDEGTNVSILILC